MKHVCLFGGTFNPPHLGHLVMANEVFHSIEMDELRFMPNALPPHKSTKDVIVSVHRVEMLKRAIEPFPYFSLELNEVQRENASYTFDTITRLKESEPSTSFSMLIGADMVQSLSSWYRIDELVQIISFYAVKRPGYTEQSPYEVTWVDAPLIELSSTMLRNRIKKHENVSLLIPETVISYIQKEHLYE